MARRNIQPRPPKQHPDQKIPNALARALADNKPSADSGALLNDLIEVWGGTRQLAIDLHAEFQKATKGGMTRQRILEMVQRLIINNTNQGQIRVINPGDMDEADLELVAMQYMRRVADSTPEGTTS